MSRNAFTSLRDTISDIAKRKTNAARARAKGSSNESEHSSVVYAESCAKIAERFEAKGFRYAKSGPHFTRKKDNFTHKVSFQTSYHNIPGQHVSLSVAANVQSPKLKKWRESQQHSFRQDGWVGGGMIHLLETDLAYISWDLANPDERKKTIDDVISFIDAVAIPYFNSFNHLKNIIKEFETRNFPAMDIASMVEFALCFDSKEGAQSILDRYVRERLDLWQDIEKAEIEFKANGFPDYHITKYADQVAFLRSAYKLT